MGVEELGAIGTGYMKIEKMEIWVTHNDALTLVTDTAIDGRTVRG